MFSFLEKKQESFYFVDHPIQFSGAEKNKHLFFFSPERENLKVT